LEICCLEEQEASSTKEMQEGEGRLDLLKMCPSSPGQGSMLAREREERSVARFRRKEGE
jgi:hypothetical protein